MSRYTLLIMLALLIVCGSASHANAVVRLENDSDETLIVFIKGKNDRNWHGPYKVSPHARVKIDLPPGIYNVVTQHPNKKSDYLGWQDYSDDNRAHKISLCVACKPIRGKLVPRLGVYVADTKNGVLVTHALENSPAKNLQKTTGDDSKSYVLVAEKAIITNINGRPIRNSSEFIKAIGESPKHIELTVSSLRGQKIEKHTTILSD